MARLITLKRRIRSITSTRQITKAMELVAASKLKRAQAQAVATRTYRTVAYDMLGRLSASRELAHQPLFERRAARTKLYVVLTSNTGLAGAYNANILKRLVALARDDQTHNTMSQVIMVGSKGVQLVRHLNELELAAYYPFFGDQPTQADMQPIVHSMIELFTSQKVDAVTLLYTTSPTSLRQEVTELTVLPAEPPTASGDKTAVMNFEPSAEVVAHHVAMRLIEVQLWQAVLEAQASEQAARMIAMKNATDNAGDLIADYTLTYQAERQAAITQEIAEISGGAEAMN